MFDSILNWIVHQVVDKKRVTIAVLAGINLAKPALEQLGVEIPDSLAAEFSSWAAIVILAIWSKMNARKAEPPG